jgi:hypothetical protein
MGVVLVVPRPSLQSGGVDLVVTRRREIEFVNGWG